MVKVCLRVWAPVIVYLVLLAVLTSGSPAPPKKDVTRKPPVPLKVSSTPSTPQVDDDDDDSYDYEYGYSSVQLLFAADSAPRKIQKACKPGYMARQGKCRRVASIKGR